MSFFSILCLASVTVAAACSESHMMSRESDAPEFEEPADTLVDGGRDGDDSDNEAPIDGGTTTPITPDGGDGGALACPDSSEREGAACTGDLRCRYVIETCACDTLYEHYSCSGGALTYIGRDYDCYPCPVPPEYECTAEPPYIGLASDDAPDGAICAYEDLVCECTGEPYDLTVERYRSAWIVRGTETGESPCQCPRER